MKSDNYITVLTFTYHSEIEIVRGRLEANGIECFVKDGLTTQTSYPAAIGGIKLQVKESDWLEAVEILKETGYIKEEDLRPSKSMEKVHHILSKIPGIKKLVN